MRMRYEENLDQTIVAMKNSRNEAEKDVVWFKGNILSFWETQDCKKSISEFAIPYNSKTGFSIMMKNSKISIRDNKKSYILSDEFKNSKGGIIVEIDELKHENLIACRSYDSKRKEYNYSKYIFEKYGIKNLSRIEGVCHEKGATYDIHFKGQQFKLDFDEKGTFQKGIQILPDGEEKELTSREASGIYTRASYGRLMEENQVRLFPSIGFKNDSPKLNATKLIAIEDWSHPLPLTSERVVKQRRLKRDYKKVLYSATIMVPMILAGLVGVKKCQSVQDRKATQVKQIQKGKNSMLHRQIQKQKNEKSY